MGTLEFAVQAEDRALPEGLRKLNAARRCEKCRCREVMTVRDVNGVLTALCDACARSTSRAPVLNIPRARRAPSTPPAWRNGIERARLALLEIE